MAAPVDFIDLHDAERAMRQAGPQAFGAMKETMAQALSECPWPAGGTRYRMWKEQCIVNYPLLYLSCIFLHKYAQKRACNSFLFATRDCPHFSKLFLALFPQYHVHYFHCSRIMFDSATSATNVSYNKYVEDLLLQSDGLDRRMPRDAQVKAAIAKTVYVDVHGTGKRIIDYFEKQYGSGPHVFLITTLARGRSQLEDVCKRYYDKGRLKTLAWNIHGGPIEQLNYDVVGTLQGYNKSGPVRDKLEYKEQYVRPAHLAFSKLCSLTHAFPLTVPSRSQLRDGQRAFDALCKTIRINRPIISKYVKHVRVHKKSGKR